MFEFCERGTLADFIQNRQAKAAPLTPHEFRNIAMQLTSGLNALHTCRIVHRDIAPRNVFVAINDASECVFKIGDFGLCKYVEDDSVWISSQKISVHEAPELLEDERSDLRCDVFSLGATLFELMTMKLLPVDCVPVKEAETMRNALVSDAILRHRYGDLLLTVVSRMLTENLAVRASAASAFQEFTNIDIKGVVFFVTKLRICDRRFHQAICRRRTHCSLSPNKP